MGTHKITNDKSIHFIGSNTCTPENTVTICANTDSYSVNRPISVISVSESVRASAAPTVSASQLYYNEALDTLGWGASYGEMSFNARPIHARPISNFFFGKARIDESRPWHLCDRSLEPPY